MVDVEGTVYFRHLPTYLYPEETGDALVWPGRQHWLNQVVLIRYDFGSHRRIE
jgi:hypothetical protein